MTTLIPKIDLKNGGSTPAGAINRTINQKLEENISVGDFGAVGDGVTDDTAAIRAAIIYAETLSSVTQTGQSKYPTYVIVNFQGGKTYKVVGNNPLGHDYATFGYTSKSYGINLNGATISWTKTGANQALIDYATALTGFSFVNGSVVINDTSTTNPNGYFVNSNDPAYPTVSAFSFHYYNSLNVSSVGFPLQTVFNINGWSQTDQTTVQSCEFTGWKTFYYSSNPEAVDWSFYDCRCFPDVENFIFFHHHNVWSGGMRIIGCELGSRTSGIYFNATNDTPITAGADAGYVYCNSRMETGVGKTVAIVDATHTRYDLVGMNFYAGGGANVSSASAVLRGPAEVKFTRCIIPNAFVMQALTMAEHNSMYGAAGFTNGVVFEDCISYQGLFAPIYIDSSGNIQTFRYCLTNNLVTPTAIAVRCYNQSNFIGGISMFGFQNCETTMQIIAGRAGGGNTYIITNGGGVATLNNSIPGYSVITSIKLHWNGIPSTYPKIAVCMGSSTTPILTVNTTTTENSAEMIPSTNIGISIPVISGDPNTLIHFYALDSSNNIANVDIPGIAVLTFRPINSASEIPSTDVPALV